MENYKIIKPLGSGGNCNAFLGQIKETGELITIKRCREDGSDTEIEKKNLASEARILGRLEHEGIPKLYSSSADEIVLEYIPGNSLEKVLLTKGAFSEKEAVRIALELSAVMRYLHGRREPVIYRDLKPSNVVQKPDGHICLIDYGAARFYEWGERCDTLNLGTPGFAAPEQFGNLGQTDPRTDIYCFGMTLLQLVSGVDPKDMEAVVSYKKNGIKGISKEFLGIIDKCTRAGREDRFRSFAEIQKELEMLPKRVWRRKMVKLVQITVAAACMSLALSGAVVKADDIKNYAKRDVEVRMPMVKLRFGYARYWIEEFVNREVLSLK